MRGCKETPTDSQMKFIKTIDHRFYHTERKNIKLLHELKLKRKQFLKSMNR